MSAGPIVVRPSVQELSHPSLSLDALAIRCGAIRKTGDLEEGSAVVESVELRVSVSAQVNKMVH